MGAFKAPAPSLSTFGTTGRKRFSESGSTNHRLSLGAAASVNQSSQGKGTTVLNIFARPINDLGLRKTGKLQVQSQLS